MRDDQELELAPGENVLGRDRLVSSRIDDSAISRRHARISVAGKKASIEDLGSKNGTYVNGKRVENKPVRLSDGDEIQLGSVFLTLRALSPEKSTESIRSPRRR